MDMKKGQKEFTHPISKFYFTSGDRSHCTALASLELYRSKWPQTYRDTPASQELEVHYYA